MSEEKITCKDPCIQKLKDSVDHINRFIEVDYKEKHEELKDLCIGSINKVAEQLKTLNGNVKELREHDIEERTAIKMISIIVVPVFLYIIYRIIDILIKLAVK